MTFENKFLILVNILVGFNVGKVKVVKHGGQQRPPPPPPGKLLAAMHTKNPQLSDFGPELSSRESHNYGSGAVITAYKPAAAAAEVSNDSSI